MGIFFNNSPASSINLEDPRHGPWLAYMIFDGPHAPKLGTLGLVKIDSAFEGWGVVLESTNVGPNIFKITVIAGIETKSRRSKALQLKNPTGTMILNALLKADKNKINPSGIPVEVAAFRAPTYQIFGDTSIYDQLSIFLARFINPITNQKAVARFNKSLGLIDIHTDDGTIPSRIPKNWNLSETTYSGNKIYKTMALDDYIEPGRLHPDGWMIQKVSVYKSNKATEVTLEKTTLSMIQRELFQKTSKYANQNYNATVVVQNSDGTINVMADDKDIRGLGLSNIPYETVPGLILTVLPGTKCTVAFHNGNPDKPYISGFVGQLGTYTHVLGTESLAGYAARADLVDARLSALEAAYNAHAHTVSTTGTAAAQTGATTSLISAVTPGTSTACSTLKLQ